MLQYAVDFEVTNRCNADCSFCPRDATPHQGLMSMEVFEGALATTEHIRDVRRQIEDDAEVAVSLCGFGEPLLHRHISTYVRRVRESGFHCSIGSNGSLLDERRGNAILEAGLQNIFINIGEIYDDYEAIYDLPFEKTLRNILRFRDDAAGRCQVSIVLVNHRRDWDHVARLEEFWRGHGIEDFIKFDIMNRGGSLVVDHMQYDDLRPEIAQAEAMIAAREGEPICGHPFWQTFFGYDGNVYLCCGDWEKRAPVGTVNDPDSVLSLADRLQPVRTREPVCKTCNHDPINHLADELRAIRQGADDAVDVEALADTMVAQGAEILANVDEFEAAARRAGHQLHRRIPVRAL